jgi:lipopolysaccharide/colanic/teichoic acid biosynthesis glycosyltransferase
MNNSELSAPSSSEDAFAELQAYAYAASWDLGTLPDEFARDELMSYDKREGESIAGVECAEVITKLSDWELRAQEDESRFEIRRPDLGFWLLYNSVAHHEQRERLRGAVRRNVRARFSSNYSSSMLKRCFDVAGSLFLMIALLPLFLLIAVAIKLDSAGPVFFRHYRVGKNGERFLLWKFRSMKTNVARYENSPRSAVDARLTRVGRWIRRLSFDEMPQLVNVLKGEMSLVGPRPEMPFIVARYHQVERERLIARPGITGLWQISPARAFPIHENLHYDLHYIRNQNFVLDCMIILRTITAVIHGAGAV